MTAPAIDDPIKTTLYYWLAGIDVLADAKAEAIVTFGDSITDGALSTVDTNHMWPAVLSARLSANKATARFGVANMGIGDPLLFDHSDVLFQISIRSPIILSPDPNVLNIRIQT